jgi:serine/threonine protein kinase
MIEDRFGKNQGVYITKPLDTWSYEATGSAARVFLCNLKQSRNSYKPAAIKIMRPGRDVYAFPLFIEEIKILKALDDVSGITQMLEMGYVLPDTDYQFPADYSNDGFENLQGRIVRYDASENINYEQMADWVSLGWLPYIALKLKNYKNNLLTLCDRARTPNHKPFELEKAVEASTQICGIFSEAHKRNIVYIDHKILHYYWYDDLSLTYVIDWNVGKKYDSLSNEIKKNDIVQFAARTLYFIFSGKMASTSISKKLAAQVEILQPLSISYVVNWSNDEDKHVPESLKELIAAAVNGGYSEFDKLQNDLMSFRKEAK